MAAEPPVPDPADSPAARTLRAAATLTANGSHAEAAGIYATA